MQIGGWMLIRKPADVNSSEITPYETYLNRRHFIGRSAMAAIAVASVPAALVACDVDSASGQTRAGQERNWSRTKSERGEELTPYEDVTGYNNFYEFGTGKGDPSRNAKSLEPRPWSIAVEGHVANPAVYDLDDFVAPHRIEERVYRLRCVEAWSMVIPWRGFPLADLIRRVEPTSRAKYLEFVTLLDPKQMPGQRRRILEWPYVEGLRMDEAMHPLTLMATGLYGRDLPNQNGAPIRLVVPWKYGFKSIKSIVKIRFLEEQPLNTWQQMLPSEYGFYANVNPQVDHPRWSQARERRIGEFRRRPTLMFNGYADQVASMYADLDLRRNF